MLLSRWTKWIYTRSCQGIRTLATGSRAWLCQSIYQCCGCAYELGHGVEVDEEKATHYYELAAMRGDERARYNLGNEEIRAGNYDRALKHYVIAAGSGYADSLDAIKQMYTKGDATKEDYTKALQSYQTYLGEIKSKQRDEAATFDSEEYQYY